MSDDRTFGSQEQRPPDPMPERVVMLSPDGRTVQVMTDDVAAFAERGFKLARADEPTAEAPARRRAKATPEEEV